MSQKKHKYNMQGVKIDVSLFLSKRLFGERQYIYNQKKYEKRYLKHTTNKELLPRIYDTHLQIKRKGRGDPIQKL